MKIKYLRSHAFFAVYYVHMLMTHKNKQEMCEKSQKINASTGKSKNTIKTKAKIKNNTILML